jgi:hypothetical protein
VDGIKHKILRQNFHQFQPQLGERGRKVTAAFLRCLHRRAAATVEFMSEKLPLASLFDSALMMGKINQICLFFSKSVHHLTNPLTAKASALTANGAPS